MSQCLSRIQGCNTHHNKQGIWGYRALAVCVQELGSPLFNSWHQNQTKIGLTIRNVCGKDITIRIRMNCFNFTYRHKLLPSEAEDTQDSLQLELKVPVSHLMCCGCWARNPGSWEQALSH